MYFQKITQLIRLFVIRLFFNEDPARRIIETRLYTFHHNDFTQHMIYTYLLHLEACSRQKKTRYYCNLSVT